MKNQRFLFNLIILLTLYSASCKLAAETMVWTNTAGGNWSRAANWSPNKVPSSTDTAEITTEGTYIVILDVAASVESLTLGSASGNGIQTLQVNANKLSLSKKCLVSPQGLLDLKGGAISGNIDVQGVFQWSGGILQGGQLSINADGISRLTGTANKTMNQYTVLNSGLFEWRDSGNIVGTYDWSYQTVAITNDVSGVMNIVNDSSMKFNNPSGFGALAFQLINRGLIRKQNSTGTNSFDSSIEIINSGTIDVQKGCISFPAGFTSSGTFQVAKEAIVEITGGTLVLNKGHQVLSDGYFGVPNGSVKVVGVNQGPFDWTGGTLADGSLMVPTNGVLRIHGNADKTLNSFVINNRGTIDLLGSGKLISYYSWSYQEVAITNEATGVIQLSNDSPWERSNPSGFGALRFILHNNGTLRKSNSTGTNVIGAQSEVFNFGLLDVQSGTISFPGGFQNNGPVQVAQGAAVEITGGTLDLKSGHRISGNGFFGVPSGSVSVKGTNSGPFYWSGGQLADGNLTIAKDGMLLLTGATEKVLNSFTIDNLGAIDWQGTGPLVAYFTWSYQKNSIINQSNGLFKINVDSDFIFRNPSGFGALEYLIHNKGLMQKAAGTGSLSIPQSVTTTNDGTIQLEQGSIVFNNGFTQNGMLNLASDTFIHLADGTFNFATNSVISGSGKLHVTEGDITVNGPVSNLEWTGGKLVNSMVTIPSGSYMNLSGTNSKSLLVSSIINAGVINWTDPGSFNGYFTWSNQTNLIHNTLSGVINIKNDSTLLFNNPSGFGGLQFRLLNEGTINKTSGNNTTVFSKQINFDNFGSFNVLQGQVQINNGFNHKGTFNLSSNCFVQLAAGSYAFNSNSFVLGDGRLVISSGDITINGSVNHLEWTGGSLVDSTIQIPTNGIIYLKSAAEKRLVRSTINNAGTIRWQDSGSWVGHFTWSNETITITNRPNGIILSEGDNQLIISNPSGFGGLNFRFQNNGVFRKNGGTNYTAIASAVNFNNRGMIDSQIGQIRFFGKPVLDPSGTLSIQIGGEKPGYEYGQIIVDGSLELTGTAAANFIEGYTPPVGQWFTNLTATALSKSFVNTNITGLSSNRYFVVATSNKFSVLKTHSLPTAVEDVVNTDEDVPINVDVLANDFDEDKDTFTLTLFTQPTHGTISREPNNLLRYAPAANYFGSDAFTYSITDINGFSSTGSVKIVVRPINDSPTLAPLANMTVDEGIMLTFTNSASDIDGDRLLYSLGQALPGASIQPETGVFSWIPSENQGPATINIGIVVTDNGTPNLSATQFVSVVINEINLPPALSAPGDQVFKAPNSLTYSLTASEIDLPANLLKFTLDNGPAGMQVNNSSGVITWTPTTQQIPSTNTVTVKVTDNGIPPLSDSKTFTVVAQASDTPVNHPPFFSTGPEMRIDELTLLSLTNAATDIDTPAQVLTYNLVNAPEGMTIEPSKGTLSWTPTESQGPSTNIILVKVTDDGVPSLSTTGQAVFIVTEINLPPVMAPLGNQAITLPATLSVTASATDADIPANKLVFDLLSGPTGLTIDVTSGLIQWTPSSPGTNIVVVRVQDDGLPPLSATQQFLVVVTAEAPRNHPPFFGTLPEQWIEELATLTLTNTAMDIDTPLQTLTYSLLNAPQGMSIDPARGILSWIATESQGPSTNIVLIKATDNGSPILGATGQVVVIVAEKNLPPILMPIANQSIVISSALSLTASATDPDIPENTLLFELLSAPTGLSVNGNSGLIQWTPSSPGTNIVVVRVQDDGLPPLSITQQFLVVVSGQTQPSSGVEYQAGPNMIDARMYHLTAALPNGRFAVFGGHGTGFRALNSMEIWHPQSNAFFKIELPHPYDGGALVKLNDTRYLLAGSATDSGGAPGYNLASIYDDVTGKATATTGKMVRSRCLATGAKLASDRALIVGAWYATDNATYGEIFDPATQTFTATGPLNTPRAAPLVIPTPDGKAVVVGGRGVFGSPSYIEQTELYDPVANKFTVLASSIFPGEPGWNLYFNTDRIIEDCQLSDGRFVFLTGRTVNNTNDMALAFFNPANQQFTRVPFKPAWTNSINIFNVLDKSKNQLVLFEGKYADNKANFTFSVYRLDIASGQWTTISDPITITDYYVGGSAVTRLPDGRIFVTGGTTSVDYQFNFSAVRNTFSLKALEPPQVEVLFDNGNIAAVSNKPTKETTFTLSRTAFITMVRNYHYFNHGALPGTISLRHSDSTIYGPWQTFGQVGQGNVPNAYWVAEPMIEIKAGTYTVIDSDPATWSHNSGSGNAGFTLVNGYYMGTPVQNPYIVWAQSRKLTEQNWDRSADPDQDGLVNEIEYALLTDPLVKDLKSNDIWPTVFRANGYLAINYRQRSGGTGMPGINYQADGIQYIWEISSDMKSGSWKVITDAFDYIGNSRIDNGDGTEGLAIRYKDPFGNATKLFFRLRIIDASIP